MIRTEIDVVDDRHAEHLTTTAALKLFFFK